MGRLGGAIAAGAAASLLAAGCGSDPSAAEFDPSVPAEFIRNKARADVRANPTILVEDPQDPEVSCERSDGGGEEAAEATFVCRVRIVGEGGETLARQTWQAGVELDPVTNDTVVRSSRRVRSTIAPAT